MMFESKPKFLKYQVVNTERLLELAKDHPLMSITIRYRLFEFKNKLRELEENAKNKTTPL